MGKKLSDWQNLNGKVSYHNVVLYFYVYLATSWMLFENREKCVLDVRLVLKLFDNSFVSRKKKKIVCHAQRQIMQQFKNCIRFLFLDMFDYKLKIISQSDLSPGPF